MATYDGVILKTVDYKESSKLLYIYTSTGIKSTIAHGVKKLASAMRHSAQTGMHGRFNVSEGKLPAVKDIELLHFYPNIKKDYMKVSVQAAIQSLIYFNVTPHDNHAKLYAFLLKVLDALEETTAPLEILSIVELKVLYFLGNAINLKACPECAREDDLYFDGVEGSVYCKTHATHNQQLYDDHVVEAMRYFYYVKIEDFKPLGLDEKFMHLIFEITDGLYKHHADYTSKAKTLLKSLL